MKNDAFELKFALMSDYNILYAMSCKIIFKSKITPISSLLNNFEYALKNKEYLTSSKLIDNMRRIGTTPDLRRATLKRLISSKDIVRIIESHSPLSALIGEKVSVNVDNKFNSWRSKYYTQNWGDKNILNPPFL